MKEDYVSFECAKLLKEKGFDEPLEMLIREDGTRYHADTNSVSRKRHIMLRNSEINIYSTDISCPTLQMAMKWLREEHNIHITIDCDICDSFDFYSMIRIKIEESWKTYVEYEDEGSNTYEEAIEKTLKHCLENLI